MKFFEKLMMYRLMLNERLINRVRLRVLFMGSFRF